jgi:hypothetical protein
MFVITYANEKEGVFYHGTFSLIQGRVGASWTYTLAGGEKKTIDMPMTGEEFRQIWDSHSEIGDFQRGAVTDPNQKMDFTVCHVIGAVFDVEGKKGMRTYLIPVDNPTDEFKQWLSLLKLPTA